MEYENKSDKTYAKIDKHKYKVGSRAIAGENLFSAFEATADAGVETGEWGATAGAGARAHAFQFGSDDVENLEINARFIGVDVKAQAGYDLEGFFKEGKILGAEAKARVTMSEVKAGPFNLHLGAGVSTGAKVEDGTFDAKLAGCGLKVGKKIGVAVFDNEFSVDTLALDMEYENKSDKAYAKKDKLKYKAGARVDGDDTYSALEASADAGVETSEWGVTAGAGARVHAFQVGREDVNVNARFLGADVGAQAGYDLEGFVKEGKI
ncbi:hypothetical protein AWC38_SpisGene4418 [Stylophora pistillata]|uniref:Uncharacterized protein n=1 Tax=Stylophora pistillata TaxID=50429 RepID=A0A2B4SQQ0_STYPI|nr:hypothetical protein AWC38_SpisGene4418 [Stylophora pistillata]